MIESEFEKFCKRHKHLMELMGDFDKHVIKKAFVYGVEVGVHETRKIIEEAK